MGTELTGWTGYLLQAVMTTKAPEAIKSTTTTAATASY